jgi:hypothetical protein
MASYKLIIPPMTIHFCEKYPMRKKPVMSVSFEGENAMYKVASFNDEKTFNWFVECLNEALKAANVRRFPADKEED